MEKPTGLIISTQAVRSLDALALQVDKANDHYRELLLLLRSVSNRALRQELRNHVDLLGDLHAAVKRTIYDVTRDVRSLQTLLDDLNATSHDPAEASR